MLERNEWAKYLHWLSLLGVVQKPEVCPGTCDGNIEEFQLQLTVE